MPWAAWQTQACSYHSCQRCLGGSCRYISKPGAHRANTNECAGIWRRQDVPPCPQCPPRCQHHLEKIACTRKYVINKISHATDRHGFFKDQGGHDGVHSQCRRDIDHIAANPRTRTHDGHASAALRVRARRGGAGRRAAYKPRRPLNLHQIQLVRSPLGNCE